MLFLAGTALQFFVGRLNPSFLSFPWGIVLAVNYLYLLILAYCFADKWKWVKSYYDRSACIVSLFSLLLLTLLFGLVRQDASEDGIWGIMGFTQMTSSWIFNIFLLLFMTVMGLKSIDDLYHWKKRKLSATVFHVAFFIVLIAGIFGSGDKLRVKVVVTSQMLVHQRSSARRYAPMPTSSRLPSPSSTIKRQFVSLSASA